MSLKRIGGHLESPDTATNRQSTTTRLKESRKKLSPTTRHQSKLARLKNIKRRMFRKTAPSSVSKSDNFQFFQFSALVQNFRWFTIVEDEIMPYITHSANNLSKVIEFNQIWKGSDLMMELQLVADDRWHYWSQTGLNLVAVRMIE